MYLLPSGFHRPRLSDTHARSTGSEKTIFTFWIPPWNWKVRASLQISGLLPKYLTDDNRNLIRAIEIRVFKLRNIWVCIVELFFLLHSLRDAGPRQQFGKHVSRLPDVASDTSANFLFTSFLQASRETPWLRAAVSLHHSPVWAWCHGEQTASHGDCYWGPHHPHPSHLWGYCPANVPYRTGQSKSHCWGKKGGPSSSSPSFVNQDVTFGLSCVFVLTETN